MKPPTGGRSGGAHQCALEECEHGLQLLQLGLQGLGRGAALTAERHYGPAELLQLRGYCRGVGALALRLSMPLLTMPFLGIMALLLSFTMSIIGVAVTVLALGIAVVIAPHVTVATGGATTASGAVVAVVAPETVGARCTLCGRPRDADIMTAFLFTAFLGGMVHFLLLFFASSPRTAAMLEQIQLVYSSCILYSLYSIVRNVLLFIQGYTKGNFIIATSTIGESEVAGRWASPQAISKIPSDKDGYAH